MVDEDGPEKGLVAVSGGILERELEVSLKSRKRVRKVSREASGEENWMSEIRGLLEDQYDLNRPVSKVNGIAKLELKEELRGTSESMSTTTS